jgi:hypothetical protein
MAILDPPFSILDLANARALPLSLFEQSAKGIFGIPLGWWLARFRREGRRSSKKEICISCRTC